MILLPAWRSAPANPGQLNKASTLSKGLVFAFAGHSGTDIVGAGRPINTNVNQLTGYNKRNWSFNGGVQGNSDLNFGHYAATQDLHEQPATWAFVAQNTGAIGLMGIACHSDTNTDRGWQLCAGGIGISMVRSSTNVSAGETSITPTQGVPFVVVITYDGTNNSSGINIYYEGRHVTPTSTSNGVGTTGPATAENLYLGRQRFGSARSYQGDIYIGAIANRVWTDAEAYEFYKNPYSIFQPGRSSVYSFGALPTSAITGEADVVFGQSASGSAVGFLTGESDVVFGTSGNLNTNSTGSTSITFGATGSLISSAGGISNITFGASGSLLQTLNGTAPISFNANANIGRTGAVGEFEYVPCDDCAPSGPPIVTNVIPAEGVDIIPSQSLQFDVIDTVESIRRIITYISYPHNNMVEIIHTGDAFCPKFAGSTRTPIGGGYRYDVSRVGGWLDSSITITIDAIADSGAED